MSITRVFFQGGVGAVSGVLGVGALSALNVIKPAPVDQIALASGVGNAALTVVLGSRVANLGLFGSAVAPIVRRVVQEDTPMLHSLVNNPLWLASILALREMVGAAMGTGLLLALSQSTVPFSQTVMAAGVGATALSVGINLTVGLLISLGVTFTRTAHTISAELAHSAFKSVGGP